MFYSVSGKYSAIFFVPLKSWFVKNIAKQSVSDIIVCTCIFILLFHVLVILNWPMIVDLAWVFFLIKQSKSHLASNCNNLILRLYLEIHIQLFLCVHREEISYYQFIEKFRCQYCWLLISLWVLMVHLLLMWRGFDTVVSTPKKMK